MYVCYKQTHNRREERVSVSVCDCNLIGTKRHTFERERERERERVKRGVFLVVLGKGNLFS
jgi:hypothetical protein